MWSSYFKALQDGILFIGDTVFPPSPEALLLRHTDSAELAQRQQVRMIQGVTVLHRYQDPIVRAAISELKFHSSQAAAILLAASVSRYVHTMPQRETLILPVPLSRQRLYERGHNQVETVLRHATLPTHIYVHSNLLTRTRHTPPQTTLAKAERLTNLKNAFALKKPHLLTGKHVVLIDDVTTTGSTLTAAAKVVRHTKPASVQLLALAH